MSAERNPVRTCFSHGKNLLVDIFPFIFCPGVSKIVALWFAIQLCIRRRLFDLVIAEKFSAQILLNQMQTKHVEISATTQAISPDYDTPHEHLHLENVLEFVRLDPIRKAHVSCRLNLAM